MKLRASLFLLAVTASPLALAADLPSITPDVPASVVAQGNDYYVSIFGGVTFGGESDLSGIVGGAPQSVDIDNETGFIIGGAAGVSFNDFQYGGLTPRLELEVSYSENDADDIFFSGNGPGAEIDVGGDVSTTLVLVNAYVDAKNVGGSKFTPYIGAGIGLGYTDFDVRYNAAAGINLSDSDVGFAAQGIIGVSYELTDNLDVNLDARYSRVFDVETPRLNGAGVNTGDVDGDVDNFAITTGIRYKF